MKLASSFAVPAAADKVVALFLDPATMQSCIPGCEELVQTDETHYRGSLVNEVAHVKFTAGFVAEIVSVTQPVGPAEPAVVTAVLRSEDRRLGSTIRMDATLTVTPEQSADGEASQVGYEFELAIRGKLGRLGEAVIRRRTAEVERQFAEALTAICAGKPVPQSGSRRAVAPSPRAGDDASAGVTGSTGTGSAGVPVRQSAPVAPAPAPARPDWLVLGLAVAAAFGYGVLFGQRSARR